MSLLPFLATLARADDVPPAAATSSGPAEAAASTGPPAEPPRPTPTVKVSLLLFPQWSIDLTEGAAFANAISLERTYLRVEATVTDTIGARLTLDSRRDEPPDVTVADGSAVTVTADQRYGVFVKQAWIEFRPIGTITVRGGIIDTPLIPFLESWQGARWIHKTFLDDIGLGSSADLGLNVSGKHGNGALAWTVGVYNGETYKSEETGSGKSVQARLTVDPLALRGEGSRLPVSVFVNENVQQDGLPATFTWAGDAGFKHPNLYVDAQVVGSTEAGVSGLGESGQVAPGIPAIGCLFVRVDHWDPDLFAPGDDSLTLVVGPAHDFVERVSLGAFYARTTYASAPGKPEHSVSLQAQVGF